jgi:putative transposase
LDGKTLPFPLLQDQQEIIRLAVMLYIRFPLSLRNVEDLLYECGIEISHERCVIGGTGLARFLASHIQKGLAGFVRVLTRN